MSERLSDSAPRFDAATGLFLVDENYPGNYLDRLALTESLIAHGARVDTAGKVWNGLLEAAKDYASQDDPVILYRTVLEPANSRLRLELQVESLQTLVGFYETRVNRPGAKANLARLNTFGQAFNQRTVELVQLLASDAASIED